MRLLVLLSLLALAGCSLLWPGTDDDGDVYCLAIFNEYRLDVTLPDGTPADSVRLFATNERTGTTYGPCDGVVETGVGCADPYEPGRYTVYTDGLEASPGGDDVTVRGSRGDLAFEAAFRFSQGVCGIGKVAGPDSVTLR